MRRSLVARIALCSMVVCSMLIVSAPGVATAGGNPWHWLNPLPRGETLNDVGIAPDDANWGYAVGNFGCVMKTTDGGANWHLKTPPAPADPSLPIPNLYSVSVISASTAWVSGENGYVARTTDYGSSWTLQDSKMDGTVTEVFFLNQWEGWACSNTGKLAYTADGGTTWTLSSDIFPGVYFQSLYFTSDSDGFAVATGGVYKTTNGGIDWVMTHTWTGSAAMDVAFMPGNPDIGWAVCFNRSDTGNSAYRTSNHGVTWEPIDIGYGYWSSICMNADGTVWVAGAGSQPKRLATFADGPAPVVTEMAYAGYSSPNLNALDCSSGSAVLAVGGSGTIVRTANGGTTWTARSSMTQTNFYDVQFLDLRTGYACTDAGKVWKTTNAGVSWTATSLDAGVLLYELYFLDENTGWAVGAGGRIYKTINGGVDWSQQTTGVTDELLGVRFVDANKGWAVGQNGRLLSTSNGGTSWSASTLGSGYLTDIDFYGTQDGVVVGSGGAVYVTSNGGTNWSLPTGPASVTPDFESVDMVDATTFYAGSNPASSVLWGSATLLKATADGATWNPAPLDNTARGTFNWHSTVFDIQFVDANNGWVSFSDGYVGKTTDGGVTWQYTRVSDDRFTGISVVSGYAWGVGVGGKIMSTYWYSPTKVYRFYHLQKGTHFYTTDVDEKHNIINTMSHIYKYEGVGYEYDPYHAPDPLYRFYNFRNGTHFYTADTAEYTNTLNNLKGTYSYDGPAYNVSRGTVPGRPVWRFYNKRVGSHFYTADPTEKANVQNNLGQYFSFEGVAFYLPE